jgi:hypothetical protein
VNCSIFYLRAQLPPLPQLRRKNSEKKERKEEGGGGKREEGMK